MNLKLLGLLAAALLTSAGPACAQDSPEAIIKRAVEEVTVVLKSDADIKAGNRQKINALVDSKILPYLSVERMTQAAAGRHWTNATPEQKLALTREFKILLTNTYAGAFTNYRADTVIEYRAARATSGDTESVVRSVIKTGASGTIQLDYYLEKIDGTWKVTDFNVIGVRIVEAYKSQFNAAASADGMDGIIKALAAKNRAIESRGKA